MQTVILNITPKKQSTKKNGIYVDRCVAVALIVLMVAMALWIGVLTAKLKNNHTKPLDVRTEDAVIQVAEIAAAVENEPTEATEFFALTSEQRTLIEQIVSAESRGEPYDGQVAVAQCILNACLKDNIAPEDAIEKYMYTGIRVEPTDSVKEAVAAVFDRGEGVTEEPILYFYAPARVTSKWHESQDFVIEIASHRFFKEAA